MKVAMCLLREIHVRSFLGEQSVAVDGLADGCTGILLVFDDAEKAEAFAGAAGTMIVERDAPLPERLEGVP